MRRRNAIILGLTTAALLAVFFLYPTAMVVRQAFADTRGDGGGWTLDFMLEAFRNPVHREGLWNALALGLASTLAALGIAFPLALVGHRHEFPGKRLLAVLLLAPLILPPFVGAVGIKQMLGVNGALNSLLAAVGIMDATAPIDWLARGRFVGIVVLNALHLYPILWLNISASLARLDPAMEQAAANLGCPPWRRFWRITLPLAMPGVFAGSSLVFIWAFTELGVPLVFDYSRVTPVQIFDGLKALDNNPLPYALTAVLLVVSALVYGLSKLVLGRSRAARARHPARAAPPDRLRGWRGAACTGLFGGVFLVAAMPHLGVLLLSCSERWYGTILPQELTLRHYLEALADGLVVPSIRNSLLYASGATIVATATGLAVAWVVVRSNLRLRGLLDTLAMLPLAVPGLVMAFGYLALTQQGKPFHFLIGADGSPLLLLVIAYAIRRLPYIVRAAAAGLQQSDPALEEAAQSLGATPLRTLLRVAVPLIGAHLAAGGILVFAFSMLEVSDSLVLAQQTQHFPITKAIYTLLGTLGNGIGLAAALGVWAMVFLVTSLLAAGTLAGKRGGIFKV